jgi:hypothetical protein
MNPRLQLRGDLLQMSEECRATEPERARHLRQMADQLNRYCPE